MQRFARVVLGSIFLVLAAASAHAQQMVEVTTCGQVVPRKAVGYLSGDVDCTGFTGEPPNVFTPGAAVYLDHKASLDLRGFTLTAGMHGVLCNDLQCGNRTCSPRGPCSVFNGTITGAASESGRGIGGAHLHVDDVTVTDSTVGIYGYGRLYLSNCSISGNTDTGARSGRTVVSNCSITDNGLQGVAASNTNNGRAIIANSTVTGNGLSPECASFPDYCADIESLRRPRLINTTCDVSRVPVSLNPDGTWFVCAMD